MDFVKAILLSLAALAAAAWGGNFAISWIVQDDAGFLFVAVYCFLAALALQIGALNSARAQQSRMMFRDLRSIEALLDDREFDRG